MDFEKNILIRLERFAGNTPWKDDTDIEVVVEASKKAFEDMSRGCKKEKVLCRLCGQSGSGKTSQLLASILPSFCDGKACVVAVRNFVKYHPRYDELLSLLPKGELREYTNGFALKCLFLTLCRLLQNGCAILYDVTVLEPAYEEMLNEQLKKYGYTQLFSILAVPLEQSRQFIEKRQHDCQNKEHGRIISEDSVEYFYSHLETGLDYYVQEKDPSPVVMWTAYNKKPVYLGQVKNSKAKLIKYRNSLKKIRISEKKLLLYKQKFYRTYLVKKVGKNNV